MNFVARLLSYPHPIFHHNYGKCFAMTIENLIVFYNVDTVKKTTTMITEAIPFSILLQFFGFIKSFSSFQGKYCSFIKYFVIVKMNIIMK